MSLTQPETFECPYCMVINDIEVDPQYDLDQQQIVDCQICCQPIEVQIIAQGDQVEIIAKREDE